MPDPELNSAVALVRAAAPHWDPVLRSFLVSAEHKRNIRAYLAAVEQLAQAAEQLALLRGGS